MASSMLLDSKAHRMEVVVILHPGLLCLYLASITEYLRWGNLLFAILEAHPHVTASLGNSRGC